MYDLMPFYFIYIFFFFQNIILLYRGRFLKDMKSLFSVNSTTFEMLSYTCCTKHYYVRMCALHYITVAVIKLLIYSIKVKVQPIGSNTLCTLPFPSYPSSHPHLSHQTKEPKNMATHPIAIYIYRNRGVLVKIRGWILKLLYAYNKVWKLECEFSLSLYVHHGMRLHCKTSYNFEIYSPGLFAFQQIRVYS